MIVLSCAYNVLTFWSYVYAATYYYLYYYNIPTYSYTMYLYTTSIYTPIHLILSLIQWTPSVSRVHCCTRSEVHFFSFFQYVCILLRAAFYEVKYILYIIYQLQYFMFLYTGTRQCGVGNGQSNRRTTMCALCTIYIILYYVYFIAYIVSAWVA